MYATFSAINVFLCGIAVGTGIVFYIMLTRFNALCNKQFDVNNTNLNIDALDRSENTMHQWHVATTMTLLMFAATSMMLTLMSSHTNRSASCLLSLLAVVISMIDDNVARSAVAYKDQQVALISNEIVQS